MSTARGPEEIQQEIEETRREMGDTVEALAAKADVKARVHERIDATKESVAEKLDSTKESVAEKFGKAREASPDDAVQIAGQATQTARENPIPVAAVGAFVGGFLLGRLTKRG